MKFLSRLLAVFAVLGGLGYGSYAFGKYVLSAKLFGPQGQNIRPKNAALETPGNVEVEILPAEDGADDTQPRILPERRVNSNENAPQNNVVAAQDTPETRENDERAEEERPRRRRVRRRDREERERAERREREARTREVAASAPLTTTAREENSRNTEFSPRTETVAPEPQIQIEAPRESAPRERETREPETRESAPAEAPRVRVRERETRENSEETPRRRVRERRNETTNSAPAAPRVPTRERERSAPAAESPVPVPEGGGESPVPVAG